MPNVDIPQGMDAGGSPKRQETIGGTLVHTRSESVLEQPNEPPLSECHTFGSEEGRMEHTIELTYTIPPTPYDLPLTGGYTPGSDEGRLKLDALMDLCTPLSNKGRMIEELDKDENVNLVSEQGEVHETTKPLKDDDDATLAKTLLNIKRSTSKDKGEGIIEQGEVHETTKPLKDDDDATLAKTLLNIKRSTSKDKGEGNQTQEIDWNDPKVLRYHALQNRAFSKAEVRKNMCMYLKNQGGYKQSYFKGMKYEDIRPIFERVWDQIHNFVPKDSEIKKEVMKRSRFHLQQESSKNQKLNEQTEEEVKAQVDSDQKVEEIKLYMRIVLDEEIAYDAIPLTTKPLVIVEYKIVKKGKISTYHITRSDGSTKRYTSMINLLENINRKDLKTLWKLVKDKHRNTRLEEGYERVL
nr:hypothetical protein [Tanacetum cinerariifolium]